MIERHLKCVIIRTRHREVNKPYVRFVLFNVEHFDRICLARKTNAANCTRDENNNSEFNVIFKFFWEITHEFRVYNQYYSEKTYIWVNSLKLIFL